MWQGESGERLLTCLVFCGLYHVPRFYERHCAGEVQGQYFFVNVYDFGGAKLRVFCKECSPRRIPLSLRYVGGGLQHVPYFENSCLCHGHDSRSAVSHPYYTEKSNAPGCAFGYFRGFGTQRNGDVAVKTVVDIAHHLAENPAVSRGVGYMVHSDVVVNHFMKKNVLNLVFGEVAIGTDDNNEVCFSFPAPQISAPAVSHHSEIAFGFAQFYWRNVESGIENGFVEQTEFFNKQVNCRNHWVSWQSLLPCRYK